MSCHATVVWDSDRILRSGDDHILGAAVGLLGKNHVLKMTLLKKHERI